MSLNSKSAFTDYNPSDSFDPFGTRGLTDRTRHSSPPSRPLKLETLTSVSQYVSIMEKYQVEGPRYLNRIHLEHALSFKPIGKGAQFSVYKLTSGTPGMYDRIVVKRVHYYQDTTDQVRPGGKQPGEGENLRRGLKTLEREVRSMCLKTIRENPNVVKLLAWGFDYSNNDPENPQPVLFLEEAVGNLQDLLQGSDAFTSDKITMQVKYQLCLDIASGLSCLHQCQIVHGDLKPGNILVFQQHNPRVPWLAKLADFGLSILIEDGEDLTLSRYRSTEGWKPPETIKPSSNRVSSEDLYRCDSYSYGLVCLSIMVLQGDRLSGDLTQNTEMLSKEIMASIEKQACTEMEKRLAQKKTISVISEFLSWAPSQRSLVSPAILRDENTEAYHDWKLDNEQHQAEASKVEPSIRQGYTYWRRLDPTTLATMQREIDNVDGHTTELRDVMLGMCISNIISKPDGFRLKALRCCRAAAEGQNTTAQAILPHLSAAIDSEELFKAENTEKEALDLLYRGSLSGSLVAASALRKLDSSRLKNAQQQHRMSGGYNSEAFDKGRPTTPLYKACAAGNAFTARKLLEMGADASSARNTADGVSCLHWLFSFQPEDMPDMIKLLLKNGASVECRTDIQLEHKARKVLETEHFPFHWPHGTPFHWACHAGSVEASRLLLDYGADVDALDAPDDSRAHTALGLAMARGDAEVVSFLLRNGADPNKQDTKELSPLHILAGNHEDRNLPMSNLLRRWCYHGSFERSLEETRRCVEEITKHGGQLNLRRRVGGLTALLDATEAGDCAVVLALLEAGADADLAETYAGRLPLHHWVMKGPERTTYPKQYFKVLEALVHHTTDAAAREAKSGNSALHAAQNNEDGLDVSLMIFETLLPKDPASRRRALNAVNSAGETALLYSTRDRRRGGPVRLSYALLDLGSDAAVRDNKGRDYLYNLAWNDIVWDDECLEAMQRHTANLDDAGKKQALNDARHQESGTTALMGLASKCAAKCVRWALELGADVAPRNRVGRTALDYAAEQGNVQRTIFLEKWAENYDKSVKAPANRAEMQEYRQLFRDFVKAPGRDTTYGMEQDDEGRYFGAPEVINALIDAGAKLGHTGGYNAARKDDRIFMDNYRCPWFVPEKQPCYEQWKILYELDEENPKGFDHGFRHQDLKASPTLRPVR